MLSPDQIDSVKAEAFCGAPSRLRDVCKVYPFTIKEIMNFGNVEYRSQLSLLLLSVADIADIMKKKTGKAPELDQINPLSYLLQSAARDDTFFLELQQCFSTFIKEEILLLPKINAVLVGDPQSKRLITTENFLELQDILRIQNGKEVKEPPPKDESPIARKFRLKREYAEEVKRKQQEKNGETQSLADLFELGETYGIDVQNKTLYAFYRLFRRYQAKEKWDQDIQMLCAGADSTKLKTKYWGENLDK